MYVFIIPHKYSFIYQISVGKSMAELLKLIPQHCYIVPIVVISHCADWNNKSAKRYPKIFVLIYLVEDPPDRGRTMSVP